MATMTASPTSIAGLCQSVRRNLSQNLNDELVFTSAEYTPASGTLALSANTRRIGPGTLLSWHEATLYVVSVNALNNTLEVVSGYDGGTDVTIPSGSPMRINPRFTDYTLYRAVSDAIREMSSPMNGLFFPCTIGYTGYAVDEYYPLADNITKVLQVRARMGSLDWTRLGPGDFIASLHPGNRHLRIFADAQEYQVVCAAKFVLPESYDDDAVDDCFLLPSMLDIPVIGASATLMYGQESRRVHQAAQGDPRRAEDVPMTGASGAARDLRRLFQQRIDEEHASLISNAAYRIG